jgi:hypothetical protein
VTLPRVIRDSALPAIRIDLAVAASGGSPGDYQLGLAMETQEQTNWCWAAVSSSVARFFSSSSSWDQCTIVCREQNDPQCCANGGSSACNVVWYLDRALQRVGHFASMSWGATGEQRIRAELAASRPVCCRIGWTGGSGHFVALSGIRSAGPDDEITVDDPFYGQSTMPLPTFRSRYRGTGSWTHTYYTN